MQPTFPPPPPHLPSGPSGPSGPPGPPRLGAGVRFGAAATVWGAGVLGAVAAFYGVGAVVGALMDRGVVTCGEQVGCDIGTGFLMVAVGFACTGLGFLVALVHALVMPARWTTRRAFVATAWVSVALVLLIVVTMTVTVVLDAPNVRP